MTAPLKAEFEEMTGMIGAICRMTLGAIMDGGHATLGLVILAGLTIATSKLRSHYSQEKQPRKSKR